MVSAAEWNVAKTTKSDTFGEGCMNMVRGTVRDLDMRQTIRINDGVLSPYNLPVHYVDL